MTLQGTVINGVVVLDNGANVPEGTRVIVTVADKDGKDNLREVLMKYAGCMTGLPADMAEQHDHYLHGTPKR